MIMNDQSFHIIKLFRTTALYAIIDFNFMALFFAYEVFYNKINNNDKLRIMNGFFAA